MDSAGYSKFEDILQSKNIKKLRIKEEDILRVVANDNKQRYSIKEENGIKYIRANQGHSIPVEDLELSLIEDASQFPIVVHGTFKKHWPKIRVEGLKRMGRNHIHFAIGEYGSAEVISGMRKTSEIMIYLNLEQAMKGV